MQEPSEEQQIIIDHVKEGYNILVRAVAGSGKSTTVLSLAKQLIEKIFYNWHIIPVYVSILKKKYQFSNYKI